MRVLSATVAFYIIIGVNSQINDYCPEISCKESSYQNVEADECMSDYNCDYGRKCCNGCNHKICIEPIFKEYIVDNSEYLRDKYCPKVRSCFTPLKYDIRYRCGSDEVCPYGYKCCRSDCYIHKVCVAPINKEGIEIVPPSTTTTTAAATHIISTVVTSSKLPETTFESTAIQQTSTKLQSTTTTLNTSTTKKTTQASTDFTGSGSEAVVTGDDDDSDDDEEGSGSGDGQFETIKPLVSTLSQINTTTEKTFTVHKDAISTKVQETTQPTTVGTFTTKQIAETTKRPFSTTTMPTLSTNKHEISTTVQTTLKSTDFSGSGDELTEDDYDDEDDEGSGNDYLKTTVKFVPTSSPLPETTLKHVTTKKNVISTIVQKATQASTDSTSSEKEFETTEQHVSTLTPPRTTTLKTTEKSTDFTGSGDGFPEDDDSDDDGAESSGDIHFETTKRTGLTSTPFLIFTTTTTQETTQESIDLPSSGDEPLSTPTILTTKQSDISQDFTEGLTNFASSGFTDADEDDVSIDDDDSGSGDDNVETHSESVTTQKSTSYNLDITNQSFSTTTQKSTTSANTEIEKPAATHSTIEPQTTNIFENPQVIVSTPNAISNTKHDLEGSGGSSQTMEDWKYSHSTNFRTTTKGFGNFDDNQTSKTQISFSGTTVHDFEFEEPNNYTLATDRNSLTDSSNVTESRDGSSSLIDSLTSTQKPILDVATDFDYGEETDTSIVTQKQTTYVVKLTSPSLPPRTPNVDGLMLSKNYEGTTRTTMHDYIGTTVQKQAKSDSNSIAIGHETLKVLTSNDDGLEVSDNSETTTTQQITAKQNTFQSSINFVDDEFANTQSFSTTIKSNFTTILTTTKEELINDPINTTNIFGGLTTSSTTDTDQKTTNLQPQKTDSIVIPDRVEDISSNSGNNNNNAKKSEQVVPHSSVVVSLQTTNKKEYEASTDTNIDSNSKTIANAIQKQTDLNYSKSTKISTIENKGKEKPSSGSISFPDAEEGSGYDDENSGNGDDDEDGLYGVDVRNFH